MPSEHHALLARAVEQHKIAVHLLKVTYPLAKEPKILWGAISSLIRALELVEEIQPVNPLLGQLKELWELHQKCPVEFQRKEQVVLCTEDYQCQFLTEKKVKGYLLETESFLKMHGVFHRIKAGSSRFLLEK